MLSFIRLAIISDHVSATERNKCYTVNRKAQIHCKLMGLTFQIILNVQSSGQEPAFV